MPTESFAVETRGIGKPDYSKEIALGQIRPGLSLKYLQTLRIFGITFSPIVSPYAFIATPLAVGGTANLIDWSTGLPMPYTVLQGWVYSAVQIGCAFSEDFEVRSYYDTFFVGYLVTSASGRPEIWSSVAPFSTATFDPTGATAHTYDLIIANLGAAAMTGSLSIYSILEEVGSEPMPTVKRIRCKFCGHEWVVPWETTEILCPECGKLNIYVNTSRIRQL